VPEVEVPGDPSSAAFLVVAALVLPGSEVRIDNVLLNPTRIGFLAVLREMGAQIETGIRREEPEPVGWIRARASALSGVAVGPERVPGLVDELPALAVAAAYAQGRFNVSGASELRVKESDRISAIAEGLTRMGAAVVEQPDGFSIEGGRPLHGAQVRSFGDHRIAMALVVAGLGATGATEVEGKECVAVSFPEFLDLVSSAR
jgi:3-phosphoshikimate 1-carboxyvinyltransferase